MRTRPSVLYGHLFAALGEFVGLVAYTLIGVDVLRLVLVQGLWLTAIGLALGLAFALGLTRVIVRLLYGIGANDPVTVVSVVMLLGTMSLVACYFPAHRAMRRNPVTAIREL